MKKVISGVILAIAVLIAGISVAEVQPLFNYQGRVVDSGGTPYEGTASVTLAIYDVVSGGVQLRGAVYTCNIQNGYFNIQFGAEPGMDISTLPYNVQYYLGVKVGSNNEIAPREKLGSVAYAMRAQTAVQAESTTIAATVLNGAITTAKIADDAVTRDKVAPGVISTTELADLAVTTEKIGWSTITQNNITTTVGLRIVNPNMETDAIDSRTIANGAVTQAKAPWAPKVYSGSQITNPIIAYGQGTTDSNGDLGVNISAYGFTVTPIVICSPYRDPSTFMNVEYYSASSTYFSVKTWTNAGVGGACIFTWIAIGY